MPETSVNKRLVICHATHPRSHDSPAWNCAAKIQLFLYSTKYFSINVILMCSESDFHWFVVTIFATKRVLRFHDQLCFYGWRILLIAYLYEFCHECWEVVYNPFVSEVFGIKQNGSGDASAVFFAEVVQWYVRGVSWWFDFNRDYLAAIINHKIYFVIVSVVFRPYVII